MAQVSYLDAINGVMRRLRENEVASVLDTSYSKLIGDFVNDARKYVESRWSWISLEETIVITTVAGTSNYTVTGAGESGNIDQMINTTSDQTLRLWDIERIRDINSKNPPDDTQPTRYAFDAVAANLDPVVVLYPTPDAVYSINAFVDKSGVTMTLDTDDLVIPSTPVIQMAYALALDERGDTGGSAGGSQFQLAETYIANAIMDDVRKRPDEIVWDEEGSVHNRENWNSKQALT